MTIKEGDILFLKTTGEIVQVTGGDGDNINVVRPVMTKENGIAHLDETRKSYELETAEQKNERLCEQDIQEYKRQMKLIELTQVKEPKPALAVVN